MVGFGFGYRFSRRSGSDGGLPAGNGQVLYGPNHGPRGPKKLIYAVWNQGDVGYCHETNNVAENLPAKWASRGINTWKPGHPDITLEGRAQQMLAAVKAANLMMIAAPKWEPRFPFRSDLNALDFRSLAMNDSYWRNNWIAYQVSDEMDLDQYPLSVHLNDTQNMKLDGVTKPVWANFTRRVAIPSSSVGSATINFYEAFNTPALHGLMLDSYEWHLNTTDAPVATPTRTQPAIWVAPWNNENLPGWPRFTGSVTGVAVHLQRNGPISPGRSDSGNPPVQYPPIAFNNPAYAVYGQVIPPQPMAYEPGSKANGHYIATGRVDVSQSTSYPRAGLWQPGRYLRNEGWSGFVHGSSFLAVFPQTVGSFTALGYVNAATNTVFVTSAPVKPMLGGAMRVTGPGGLVGWIRRDNPQLSGTPGSIGSYALDPAKATPSSLGSSAAPVTLTFSTEARPWGDDSNPENVAELVTLIANLNRMQAHPTGGNLMIDTAQGGRREFAVMRCPEIDGDAGLYVVDMTQAPVRAGYTAGGTPINDSAGAPPLWEFGWPIGFEGFRVLGDDGAWYLYVRSISNGNRPTWFPGHQPLGLPPRAFGPFEMVGFRRVGSAAAVEMSGTSGILKAGVDDGAPSWFWIDSSTITQNEGNTGSTAYTITIRRGGNTGSAQTVTVSTAGTGINPATASDFAGGVFPSGVLSFAVGETAKTFTASVNGDAAAEFDETFEFALSAPSGGAVLVASNKDRLFCTITNDDAALASSFVWLGSSLAGAPVINGAPPAATYLNAGETTFVTRSNVTMRAINPAFASNASFGGAPFWGLGNAFQGVEFELEAGAWEVAVLCITDPGSGGLMQVIDDAGGAANIRYAYNFPSGPLRMLDTDGTPHTDPLTAVANAVNNLTFVPVSITDRGSGIGRLRFVGGTPFVLLSAVALRKL